MIVTIRKKRRDSLFILFAAIGACFLCCEYPYSPVKQVQPLNDQNNSSRALYRININNQVCNPSISQSLPHFPACMLWLNLGTLAVKVPAQWSSKYTLDNARAHDRLTVTDTANTVTWFLLKPSFIKGDMQDPEWSTHPNYIVFLGQESFSAWNGYIVRVSDKAIVQFNAGKIEGTSTPHAWIPDTLSINEAPDVLSEPVLFNPQFTGLSDSSGMIASAGIDTFFHTTTVKITFTKRSGGASAVYFTDYGAQTPALTELPRPPNRSGWNCESPLISPDGGWVVYHCISPDLLFCESYLQRLNAQAKPVLISGNAADPHWWQNPVSGTTAIIYCDRWGEIRTALDQVPADDNTKGNTFFQSVDLKSINENLPGTINFPDNPKLLLNLPFRGGLSRDGRYMCTGYQYAYIYHF